MIKKINKISILPLKKLKCGMVLAETVYTNSKMMIVPAGRQIDEEIMQIINFFSHQRQIGGRIAVLNEGYVDRRKSA